MAPFGFTYGGSYTSQAPNAADLLCMNLYVESMEGNPTVSKTVLYPTPGLLLFCDFGDTPIRGEITVNDRTFVVAGSRLYEVDSTGTKTELGVLANDSKVVSMAAGTTQILIASAGFGFVFNFATNEFTALVAGTLLGAISFVGYCDGYFIALLSNSNQFQISLLLDATVWDALDTAKVSVFIGNVLSMIVDHREIWFYGERQTQVYQNTGNADFPFEVVTPGFIEAGIFAPQSMVQLDNSLFWLGGDNRGAGVGWRANGYTPTRVSNHAVEFAWQGYLRTYGPTGLSTAVAYSYQDQGHSFWVIYFPVPNKTWVYDVATGFWHERGAWLTQNAVFTAHRSQVHTFNFGKHLVGDWGSGKVYEMSIAYFKDDGQLIRRVRRAPQNNREQKYMFDSQLEIYLESGIGADPPLVGPNDDPYHFILADETGQLWSINIDDINSPLATPANTLDGTITATPVDEGEVVRMFFNDIEMVDQSWELVIDLTIPMKLKTVAVDFDPSYTYKYAMSSLPSFYATSMQVWNGQLQTDGPVPHYRDPEIILRWSDDGGHTWSNEQARGVGQVGHYSKRVIWRRLGRHRGRIYEASMSDPIPYRLVDAFIETSMGTGA